MAGWDVLCLSAAEPIERVGPLDCDKQLYKQRNQIEPFLCTLQDFSCKDEIGGIFLSFLQLTRLCEDNGRGEFQMSNPAIYRVHPGEEND